MVNEAAMNVVLASGAEMLRDKIIGMVGEEKAKQLTAEQIESFVKSIWPAFSKEAAENYSLVMVGAV